MSRWVQSSFPPPDNFFTNHPADEEVLFFSVTAVEFLSKPETPFIHREKRTKTSLIYFRIVIKGIYALQNIIICHIYVCCLDYTELLNAYKKTIKLFHFWIHIFQRICLVQLLLDVNILLSTYKILQWKKGAYIRYEQQCISHSNTIQKFNQ